jgi:ribosome-binding protein aMBF1 (putative translation factor)
MSKLLNEKHLEMLQHPEYAKEYAAQEEEFQIARILIRARSRSGLTQKQVAERMGTTQSVIARMESGKPTPSVKSLQRYAQATGCKMKITLEAH